MRGWRRRDSAHSLSYTAPTHDPLLRQCPGWESNPHCLFGGCFTGSPADHRTSEGETPLPREWHGWESNPQSPRFELGRDTGLQYRAILGSGEWAVVSGQSVPPGFLYPLLTTRCPPFPTEPLVGVEPTHPPYQDGKLPLHHRGITIQSTQWESNPHIRHGKATGSRYIMGASISNQSTRRGSNPYRGRGKAACNH